MPRQPAAGALRIGFRSFPSRAIHLEKLLEIVDFEIQRFLWVVGFYGKDAEKGLKSDPEVSAS